MPSNYSIEQHLPLAQLNELARLESYNKHYYRPVTYIHKWWARRLGSVFRTILLATFLDNDEDIWSRYYQGANFSDKVILDPFMGGGTTVVEALRLGCRVVGCDLNPVAWWLVKKAIEPADLNLLDEAFAQLEKQAAPRIRQWYQTKCPHCGEQVDALHVFWVKEAPCVVCNGITPLHTSFVLSYRKDQATLLCPDCGTVFDAARPLKQTTCPECSRTFMPRQGNVRASAFTCIHCGRRQTILESTRELIGPLEQRLFAVEYVCPRHGTGFKPADSYDLALYAQSQQVYLERGDRLLFPRQHIPDGLKTGDLLNHNYRYWFELFNKRQLVALDILLRAILEIQDRNTRELMLTLFSSCLEFNNMFCSYKGKNPRRPGAVRHIFSHHAFVLPREPLENNLWGIEGSSGGFSSLYESRLRHGKEYALAPVERVVRGGRVVSKIEIPGEQITAQLVSSFSELCSGEANALLLCQDSSELSLPESSVDAIITDPPYFDNVQYAELADFFYVWLRIALENDYPAFAPNQTSKEAEVVRNPRRGKTGKDFAQGLTAVFRECYRVLKNQGLLVFTFHHKADEAWAAALEAVLRAGFFISATHPIHAEMSRSVHLHNQQAVKYDAIIVCRKQTRESSISWQALERQIRIRATNELRILGQTDGALSEADTAVIVLGKCIELYSQFYPNVTDNGKQVPILESIQRMREIIEQLTHQQTEVGFSEVPAEQRLI